MNNMPMLQENNMTPFYRTTPSFDVNTRLIKEGKADKADVIHKLYSEDGGMIEKIFVKVAKINSIEVNYVVTNDQLESTTLKMPIIEFMCRVEKNEFIKLLVKQIVNLKV